MCLILDSGLYLIRRQKTPLLPTSVDFDIPSRYKKSINGKRYLLADRIKLFNGDTEQRIIVFATDEQLRLLFTSSHVMMDGTFDTCPPHFHQVYSIHAMKNDQSSSLVSCQCFSMEFNSIGFVCVVALLSGRSSLIYKELFAILTHHAGRLNLQFRPAKITSDFESALIKTVAISWGIRFCGKIIYIKKIRFGINSVTYRGIAV